MKGFYHYFKERLLVGFYLLLVMTPRKLYVLLVSFFSLVFKRRKSGKVPPILIIKVTNRCNYSCIMCPKTSTHLNYYKFPRDIEYSRLEELLVANAKYLSLVQLHGGEPLYHKEIIKILDLLNMLKLRYTLTTNGYFLTREVSEKIMNNCLRLIISVDAASDQLYGEIRKGGDISIIRENIKTMMQIRQRHRSRVPLVKIVMAVFKYNIEEIPLMVQFCHEYDIKYLIVQEGLLYGNPQIGSEQTVGMNLEIRKEVVAHSSQLAKRLDVRLSIDLPGHRYTKGESEKHQMYQERKKVWKTKTCFYLYFTALLREDFYLTYCFASFDYCFSFEGISLNEMWSGSDREFSHARVQIRKKRVPEYCQKAFDDELNCVLLE